MNFVSKLASVSQVAQVANVTLNIVAGTADEYNIRNDRGDWMEKTEGLRSLHLNEIAIPGTHNSATKDFPGVGAAYSICQTATIRQQLDAGIRYLDFRVCDDVKDVELWVSHTFEASPLEPHLNQVKEFLDAHPKEFVILQIKRDFNRKLSDNGLNQLNDLVYKLFGESIANGNAVHNQTFGELVDSGKKVTIIGGLSFGCSQNDHPRYSSSWDQTHADQPEPLHENLRNWALNDLNNLMGQGNLTNLECIITPSGDSIKGAIWKNLQEMTEPVHKMLCGEGGQWKEGVTPLFEELSGKGLNIVSFDFVCDSIVETVLKCGRVQVNI